MRSAEQFFSWLAGSRKASKSSKKKTAIIISAISALLLGIIAFSIYWTSTSDTRYFKSEMKRLSKSIDEFRDGESKWVYTYWPSVFDGNPVVVDFIASQLTEIIQNNEIALLNELCDAIAHNEFERYSAIVDAITEGFDNLQSIETAVEMRAMFRYSSGWEHVYPKLTIYKNDPLIVSHVEKYGNQPFTTDENEGYYSDENNISTYLLDDSPRCYGDFLSFLSGSGNTRIWHFRDEVISVDEGAVLDPTNSILSGDWLLCFGSNNKFVGYLYLGY